jgi:hypothetical protein
METLQVAAWLLGLLQISIPLQRPDRSLSRWALGTLGRADPR